MAAQNGAEPSSCKFCGKTRDEVRTILVSAESSICDECIVTGLDTISRQRGMLHLRFAFLVFRVVALIGRVLGLGGGAETNDRDK